MTDRAKSTIVLHELSVVCASAGFQKSPALARLLTFLVERELAGEGERLKETFVGAEFFGRAPDYDPKLDAVVRVNATRLRVRLQEYYSTAPSSTLRIVLAKGSYVPSYEESTSAVADQQQDAVTSPASPSDVPAFSVAGSTRLWKHLTLAIAVTLLLAVGTAGAFLVRFHTQTVEQQTWTTRPIARIGGSQQFADFSPDGHSVVFISSAVGTPHKSLYFQNLSDGTSRRLTNAQEDESRPVWSPDGKRVAFLRLGPGGKRDVMILQPDTGTQTKVTTLQGDSLWLCGIARLSWTPDGTTLISSTVASEGTACELVAIHVPDGAVRRIASPPKGVLGDLEAAVSPDGKIVAFLRTTTAATGDIFTVGLDGQGLVQRTYDARNIIGFCWTPDNKALLVSSDRGDAKSRLWKVPLAGSSQVALTDGTAAPTFPAMSRTGERITFTAYQRISDIWRRTPAGTKQLTDNEGVNETPSVSPDGQRLLYLSTRSGAIALWTSDANGADSRPLVQSSSGMTPGAAEWAPDGKRIIFECRSLNVSNLCVVETDSRHVSELTHAAFDQILPTWSRDGKRIYFASNRTGRYEIEYLDLTTSAISQVTHSGGHRAVESTDGNTLYVYRGGVTAGLVAIPTEALKAESAGQNRIANAEANAFLHDELGSDGLGNWQPSGASVELLSHEKVGSESTLLSADSRLAHTISLGRMDVSVQAGLINFAVTLDGRSLYYRRETSSAGLSLMEARKPF